MFSEHFSHKEQRCTRADFYTMYKREATEYNADSVEKHDEDFITFVHLSPLVILSH